jgi:hypothetical protein
VRILYKIRKHFNVFNRDRRNVHLTWKTSRQSLIVLSLIVQSAAKFMV